VAKTKMICPFSKGMCVECSLYRGRHYYLCYCTTYRGYLGKSEGDAGQGSRTGSERFEVPRVLPKSSTWLTLNDFAERRSE
jgi:hypothetical protein